jgi:hypothetical protein
MAVLGKNRWPLTAERTPVYGCSHNSVRRNKRRVAARTQKGGHRMFLGRPIPPVHRVRAAVVGAVAATVVVASGVSAASTASRPAAGTIHVYIVNTSSSTAPNNVLITGAFSDHGTGKHGTFRLTRGTITANNSKLGAILTSPSFGTFYRASCSFSGVAKGTVPIVSGTGAYAGIKGSITATATEAEQGSLLKNGKCNESNNAPAVAQDIIITGSGKVSF